MPEILILILFLCLYPFLTGYTACMLLKIKNSNEKLLLSFPVGISLICIIISSLNYFFAISFFANYLFILFNVIIVFTFLSNGKTISNDLKKILTDKQKAFKTSLLILSILLFSIPVLKHGSPTILEGLDNHDAIHFTQTARFLQNNSSNENPHFEMLHPLNYITSYGLGEKAYLPRIGSEQWLAFSATILNKKIHELYFVTLVSFLLCWLCGCLLLLKKLNFGGKIPCYIKYVLILLSPYAIHYVINSNFANFIGVSLFASFLGYLSFKKEQQNKKLVISAILLSGIISVYSDLLPTLIAILALQTLFSMKKDKYKNLFEKTKRILSIIGISFLMCFWIWIRYFATFKNFLEHTLENKNIYLLGLFRELDPWQTVIAGFSNNHSLAQNTPLFLSFPVAISVLTVFIIGIYKSKKKSLIFSALMVFVLLIGVSIFKNYTYGINKAVQQFTPFFTCLLIIGTTDLLTKNQNNSLFKYLKPVVANFFLASLLCSTIFIFNNSTFYFQNKTISESHEQLMEISKITGEEIIMIVEQALENNYWNAMWTAYFIDTETPLFFTERGGYFDRYILKEYKKNKQKIQEIDFRFFLVSTNQISKFKSIFDYEHKVIWQNEKFSLIEKIKINLHN